MQMAAEVDENRILTQPSFVLNLVKSRRHPSQSCWSGPSSDESGSCFSGWTKQSAKCMSPESEIPDNFYGWRGGVRIFSISNWFYWKWGFWCIPTLRFCVVQPCIFSLGKHHFQKNNFCEKNWMFCPMGPNLPCTRGTTIKTGILTHHRVLVGTLYSWNGRPRVVPWPLLFEGVVQKSPINHHYFWVCMHEAVSNACAGWEYHESHGV